MGSNSYIPPFWVANSSKYDSILSDWEELAFFEKSLNFAMLSRNTFIASPPLFAQSQAAIQIVFFAKHTWIITPFSQKCNYRYFIVVFFARHPQIEVSLDTLSSETKKPALFPGQLSCFIFCFTAR